MKMIRVFVSMVVLLALSSLTLAQSSSNVNRSFGKKISIGIMPSFDASGENYGEQFTQNLTHMLFDEFLGTDFEPVLLNPGGAYTPLDMDLIKDFAQISGVDAVVITTFQMPIKPRAGSYTLKMDAVVMDGQTGKTSATSNYTENIDRREAMVEGGYAGIWEAMHMGTFSSRKFEKQPLGKRARSFSKSVRQLAVSTVPTMVQTGTAQLAPTTQGSCDISFRVVYPSKKSISKSYGLIVNGREESLWMKEGIATVPMKSGRALLFVNVNDAPYRLPKQHVYASNTYVDCDKKERSLALELGGAGEGFLKWQ